MTFSNLSQIIEDNNIPKDVKLMSDSGWECSETDMDGVYYNKDTNTIIFTQYTSDYDKYYDDENWKVLSKLDGER